MLLFAHALFLIKEEEEEEEELEEENHNFVRYILDIQSAYTGALLLKLKQLLMAAESSLLLLQKKNQPLRIIKIRILG